MWVSRNLFHIGWNGNYSLWVLNPIATIPIAHGIWDPAIPAIVLSSVFSGIYNWLFISGFNSVFHLYNFVIICEFLAVISIPLGKVHLIYNSELLHWLALHKPYISISVRIFKKLALDINVHPLQRFVAYFDLGNLRLNFHTGIIIGFLSIAWCGHLVHVAIPISRGINVYWSITFPSDKGLYPFYTGNWVLYSHITQAILTFNGGLKSNTISLYLTDIAHLSLALGGSCGITSVVAQDIYSLLAYDG
jgi:hypothetical protein